jgi:hypothetical protein
MTDTSDVQVVAARRAAEARRAIARKIAALAPAVQNDDDAQVVLHLAQAYSELASEPPRTRAG